MFQVVCTLTMCGCACGCACSRVGGHTLPLVCRRATPHILPALFIFCYFCLLFIILVGGLVRSIVVHSCVRSTRVHVEEGVRQSSAQSECKLRVGVYMPVRLVWDAGAGGTCKKV